MSNVCWFWKLKQHCWNELITFITNTVFNQNIDFSILYTTLLHTWCLIRRFINVDKTRIRGVTIRKRQNIVSSDDTIDTMFCHFTRRQNKNDTSLRIMQITWSLGKADVKTCHKPIICQAQRWKHPITWTWT